MKDYSEYFERIIALLEEGRGAPPKPASSRPVHSGHKGGAFMSEARTAFKDRFESSDLEWSTVNKWITLVFGLASKAQKGATAQDMEWLFSILSTSLQNGFAFVIKEMED